jgi:copper(I)-binding protein
MLIGLTRDLKPGESLPIVLQFKDGSRKEVQAPVRKIVTKMQKSMQ